MKYTAVFVTDDGDVFTVTSLSNTDLTATKLYEAFKRNKPANIGEVKHCVVLRNGENRDDSPRFEDSCTF
jgi:hypothetical protein